MSNNNNAHSITKYGVLGRLDVQIVVLSAAPKRSPVGHGSRKMPGVRPARAWRANAPPKNPRVPFKQMRLQDHNNTFHMDGNPIGFMVVPFPHLTGMHSKSVDKGIRGQRGSQKLSEF